MSNLPQLNKQSLQTVRIQLLKKAVLVQVKIKNIEDGVDLQQKPKAAQKLQRRIKIALFDYAINSPFQENDNKSFSINIGKLKAICRLKFQKFLKFPLTSYHVEDQKVKSSYEVCPKILFLDITICNQSYIRQTTPSPKYLAGIKGEDSTQNPTKTKLTDSQLKAFLQTKKLYSDKFDYKYFQSNKESTKKTSIEDASLSKRVLTLEKMVFSHGIRGDVDLMKNLYEEKFFKKCNFNFADYNEPLFKMNIYDAFRAIGSLNLSESNKDKFKKMVKMLITSTRWRDIDEKKGVSLYNLTKSKELRNLLLPLAKCL